MTQLDEIGRYREALEKIAALDPEKDVEQGVNEWWADAQCFDLAKEIARQALRQLP